MILLVSIITVFFTSKLSVREKEILALIIKEFTTDEIANELFVSIKTVESDLSNLIQKLGGEKFSWLSKSGF